MAAPPSRAQMSSAHAPRPTHAPDFHDSPTAEALPHPNTHTHTHTHTQVPHARSSDRASRSFASAALGCVCLEELSKALGVLSSSSSATPTRTPKSPT